MSVQVENLEHNMAKLTINVSAEELEKALDSAYKKQKGQISVPGFRKGKVPSSYDRKDVWCWCILRRRSKHPYAGRHILHAIDESGCRHRFTVLQLM